MDTVLIMCLNCASVIFLPNINKISNIFHLSSTCSISWALLSCEIYSSIIVISICLPNL